MPDDTFAADLLAAFPPVPTEAWLDRVRADLQGKPLDALDWTLPEGVELKPFYRADDLDGLDLDPLPAPARAIFRHDVLARDLDEANRRARAALDDGAEALGFHIGTGAPDDLPVLTAADLHRLLDGLPASTRLEIHTAWLARPLLAVLTERAAQLGLIANDPIGVLLRSGPLSVEAAMDEAAALLADADALGVPGQVLRVDLGPVDEAGGTAVEALALGLAAASELFARLGERGVETGRVARRLRFAVPVGTRYFVEIARLRALRRLVPLVTEAYGAGSAATALEAATSRWTLTRYDPHANLLRHATEAASALVGGCDVLCVRPFDAAAGASSEHALHLARTLPLILRHEAHLEAVADPAAGSYYVELLTDRLARATWTLFQEIEGCGGLIEALQAGFLQDRIRRSRTAQREALATRRRVLIGVNHYPDTGEAGLESVGAEPAPAAPSGYSAARDLGAVRAALRDGAALGAVLDTTRQAGVRVEPLDAGRLAAPFEALRRRVEQRAQEDGRRPVAFLLLTGEAALAHARATFARNVLGCGGFLIAEADRFDDPTEGARAALDQGADLAVLCAPDAAYPEAVAAVDAVFRETEAAPLLVVAGPPAALGGGTAPAFLHRGADVLALLESLSQRVFADNPDARP